MQGCPHRHSGKGKGNLKQVATQSKYEMFIGVCILVLLCCEVICSCRWIQQFRVTCRLSLSGWSECGTNVMALLLPCCFSFSVLFDIIHDGIIVGYYKARLVSSHFLCTFNIDTGLIVISYHFPKTSLQSAYTTYHVRILLFWKCHFPPSQKSTKWELWLQLWSRLCKDALFWQI
jgi:hypothetical protein